MSEQQPVVSIVMPIYNGASLLRPTLQSLAQQTITPANVELIMVDDGSEDNPAAVVASVRLPFRHKLIQQANAGLAIARNRGIAEASGAIILFLDQDIIAHPQLLQAHIDCHRQYGPALVAGRRVPWPEARMSLVTQILDLESTDGVPPETLAQHPYQIVIGANVSIARTDIVALGGFDEEFPPGGGFEDVDMAYRAYRAGLKVVYCEGAVGSHNHPKSLQYVCKAARRYTQSANLFFFKHPELRNAFPFLIDKQPMAWEDDSPRLIIRKVGRQVLAMPPVLWTMVGLVQMLERVYPAPWLLRSLYRKIIGSYQLLGLREGKVDTARGKHGLFKGQ